MDALHAWTDHGVMPMCRCLPERSMYCEEPAQMRENHRVVRWIGVCALLLAAIATVSPAPVRAVPPIIVDKAADSDVPAIAANCPAAPAGTCTLRDAVAKSVG